MPSTPQLHTQQNKACLPKPFEKTEIKWSPYLGKLPSTTHAQNNTTRFLKQAAQQSIHCSLTNSIETTPKPQKPKGSKGKSTLSDTIPKTIVLINPHELFVLFLGPKTIVKSLK